MKQIAVILNVDETTILNESGQKELDDAISQELNWLNDSGISVENWSYSQQQKVRSTPEEFVIRLAHLAGELESKGQINAIDWDILQDAIGQLIDAYQNDPSESSNPFCLEDAAEHYFIAQFGTDQAKKTAITANWQNKTPSELISDAKKTAANVSEGDKPLSQSAGFEYDKVILKSKDVGELFVLDCYDKDDFLKEYPDLSATKGMFEIVGVHTNPECSAGYHPNRISAIWDDIPIGFRDTPDLTALIGVAPGKEYDVCYYYTLDEDKDTLYSGVDLKLSREDILNNILTNKYMEGAAIHESSRILTFDEYFNGMRRNSEECRRMMSEAQLEEVRLGTENNVPETMLLRPDLSPAKLLKLRTEIETEHLRHADPNTPYVATDYGPVELTAGFKSESNFAKYPDRVCYIPDLWDFSFDGPGITGQDILNLCKGNKLKAEMVFALCEWQHPSTILNEWRKEDDLALETKRAELEQRHSQQPTLSNLLRDAEGRVGKDKPSPQMEKWAPGKQAAIDK